MALGAILSRLASPVVYLFSSISSGAHYLLDTFYYSPWGYVFTLGIAYMVCIGIPSTRAREKCLLAPFEVVPPIYPRKYVVVTYALDQILGGIMLAVLGDYRFTRYGFTAWGLYYLIKGAYENGYSLTRQIYPAASAALIGQGQKPHFLRESVIMAHLLPALAYYMAAQYLQSLPYNQWVKFPMLYRVVAAYDYADSAWQVIRALLQAAHDDTFAKTQTIKVALVMKTCRAVWWLLAFLAVSCIMAKYYIETWSKTVFDAVLNNPLCQPLSRASDGTVFAQVLGFMHCLYTDLRGHTVTHLEEAGPNMKKYKYSTPKHAREIRLLEFSRPWFSRQVALRIFTANVDHPPPYEAVSYTWGTTDKSKHVVLNGRRLAVTPNAYDVLLRLGSHGVFRRKRVIWIDSVCINQEDVADKTHQVQLMTAIYHAAKQVIVWLGDAPDAYRARAMILRLACYYVDDPLDPRNCYHDSMKAYSAARWDAIETLCSNAWFSRVWVIQEVSVARAVMVWYGGKFVSWEMMVDVMALFRHTEASALLPTSRAMAGPLHGNTIQYFRECVRARNPRTLAEALMRSKQFDATDPRDKIFALHGICTAAQLGIFLPDYSKSVRDLYLEVAIYLLQTERNPLNLMLSYAGLEARGEAEGLPSWAPNWTSNPDLAMRLREQSMLTQGYRAGGKGICIPKLNAIDLTVECEGRCFDRIAAISEIDTIPFERDRRSGHPLEFSTHAWDEQAKTLARERGRNPYRQTANGEESIEEALWRTIIANRSADGASPAGAEYADYFATFTKYDKEQSRFANKDPIDAKGMWRLQAAAMADGTTDKTSLWSRARLCTIDRRFCVTDGGLVGLVPSMAQEGDLVAAFIGVSTPFILRAKQSQGAGRHNHFSLVGECYIHGVMEGEVFEGGQEAAKIYLA